MVSRRCACTASVGNLKASHIFDMFTWLFQKCWSLTRKALAPCYCRYRNQSNVTSLCFRAPCKAPQGISMSKGALQGAHNSYYAVTLNVISTVHLGVGVHRAFMPLARLAYFRARVPCASLTVCVFGFLMMRHSLKGAKF